MGIEHAPQRAPHGFGFGSIDAKSGTACRALDFQDIETAPRSSDDGRQPPGKCAGRRALTRNGVAGVVVEQLDLFSENRIGIGRFNRLRVGGIYESEPPGGVTNPHRQWKLLDQRAQR
jgi:hypothetical protein